MVRGVATRKRSRNQRSKKITSSKSVNRTAVTTMQSIQTTTATSSSKMSMKNSRRSLNTSILAQVRKGKSKLKFPN